MQYLKREISRSKKAEIFPSINFQFYLIKNFSAKFKKLLIFENRCDILNKADLNYDFNAELEV